ncbi:MAG: SynChlorMet cassette radical SAM/SPASM protein ScmE [Desulfomonile sp.]
MMRSPRSVDISITCKCNLQCNYCYFYGNPPARHRDLPTEEWLRFFEELGSLAVMDLCLAGGEPFFRADLKELVNGIAKNRMRFTILSNGGLVTDDIAAFLAASGRCNGVQISLDSSIRGEHDACRGEGSWDGAVRGIRILKKNGVNVTVRMTIHRHNYRNIKKTAEFILDDLGLPDFGTNAAGYAGRCRLHTDDVLLTVSERQHAMENILELAEQSNDRIKAAAGPLAEGRAWREMEAARLDGAPAFPNGGRLTSCGSAGYKLAVDADGTIMPCSQLVHIKMGRINRDSFSEIWLNHPEMIALRKRDQIHLDSFDFCRDCDYIPYCTGNCPSGAYQLVGTILHPNPGACLRRYLQKGGRIV